MVPVQPRWQTQAMTKDTLLLDADTLGRALFPPGVQVSISRNPGTAVLMAAELHTAKSMAPGRRLAFAQGRSCARDSLRAIGLPPTVIPVGEQRAPLWPAGITGAIAHCQEIAVAAAARREVVAGLGIDIEKTGPLEPGVIDLICTPVEQAHLQGAETHHARLYFAVKESIYKCVWPFVRRFIDFQEVEVELDLEGGRYHARACSPSLDKNLVGAIRGSFFADGKVLVTSAYLPPGPVL